MNKKIILGLVTATLLATSAMAYGQNRQMNQDGERYQSCKMKNNHNNQRGSQMFVKMVMNLDLTDKQRAEVMTIVKESMQGMPNPHDAFSDKAFDKKEFVKLAKQRREASIESKADMIEKVYKVLDSAQKKDLKTMLDMRDVMKKQMNKGQNCNAKNCNDRRR